MRVLTAPRPPGTHMAQHCVPCNSLRDCHGGCPWWQQRVTQSSPHGRSIRHIPRLCLPGNPGTFSLAAEQACAQKPS